MIDTKIIWKNYKSTQFTFAYPQTLTAVPDDSGKVRLYFKKTLVFSLEVKTTLDSQMNDLFILNHIKYIDDQGRTWLTSINTAEKGIFPFRAQTKIAAQNYYITMEINSLDFEKILGKTFWPIINHVLASLEFTD
jgi:hypothetical protein